MTICDDGYTGSMCTIPIAVTLTHDTASVIFGTNSLSHN
jgi:hypothetical protein